MSLLGHAAKLVEDSYIRCDEYNEIQDWAMPSITRFREIISGTSKEGSQTVSVADFHQGQGQKFDLKYAIGDSRKGNLMVSLLEEGIISFKSQNPTNTSDFSSDRVLPYTVPELDASRNKIEVKSDESKTQLSVLSKDLLHKSFENDINVVVDKSSFLLSIVHNGKTIASMNSLQSFAEGPYPTLDFKLSSNYLYGIPERADRFLLGDSTGGNPYRLFNCDRFGYQILSKSSCYGTVPILVAHNPSGESFALFWRNSSNTYLDLSLKDKGSSSLLLTSNCGHLEFFFIIAKDIRSLYFKLATLTGFPFMPPYFSLGYQHCRWSFESQADIEQVDAGFDTHKIPYDIIYLDIDHTDRMRYFTFDPEYYPDPKGLVSLYEGKNRKVVLISDPHIKKDEDYYVYNEFLEKDLFIKAKDGKANYEANCWPGKSCWVDFLNEDAQKLWASMYRFDKYQYTTPNVYVWNDMNEPAVFKGVEETMDMDNIQHFLLDGKRVPVQHRQVHNLYGICQAKATYAGLLERGDAVGERKRPYLLSRSFWAGIQKYAVVWTADVKAEWRYLRITVPMLLGKNVTGISNCGADVGGFAGNPTEELHVRWYQVGTLTPFFRGHSHKKTERREPWLFADKTKRLIKDTIMLRYKLLPYWYTEFYKNTVTGYPIMRPLWFEFPNIEGIFGEESQYLVGDALLCSPVLSENQKKITLEKLKGVRWFDFFTMEEVTGRSLEAPLEKINLFVKGGSALFTFVLDDKKHYLSSFDIKKSCDYGVIIAANEHGEAEGDFYIDEGENFAFQKGEYIHSKVTLSKGNISYVPVDKNRGNKYSYGNRVTEIVVAGLESFAEPEKHSFKFNWDERRKILKITGLALALDGNWELQLV